MQIHVVKPGDTLFNIAKEYNVPVDYVVNQNEIEPDENLVIGSSLVIPIKGSYHEVQLGESLYSISKQYGIMPEDILELNEISDPRNIQIGDKLFIPPKVKYGIDVSAYLDYQISRDKAVDEIREAGDLLTYITMFNYRINDDGTLVELDDQEGINESYNKKTVPLLVLTNIKDDQFSREFATEILSDEKLQDKILDEAIKIMDEKGYLGLDFDFEYLGAENKEKYVEFLKKARDKLKPKGYLLSAALAPKTSADQKGVLYEGHDYEAIGKIVDFIYVMTYEWGWSGGPPMAVAPINQVRKVMEYALTEVPNYKLMMGMPLYGYDWTLPYVKGGKWAKAISPAKANELARKYNVEIQYDEDAQSPYFNYTDEEGNEHEVWFEDARSVQAKFDLVKELVLKGFYYWVLGYDFPQNWLLIDENFVVRKRI